MSGELAAHAERIAILEQERAGDAQEIGALRKRLDEVRLEPQLAMPLKILHFQPWCTEL